MQKNHRSYYNRNILSGACSNDEPTGGKGHQQTYSVVLKGITVAGEESSEELKDVSVFQFSDGNLYKEEQLTPGKGGSRRFLRSADLDSIF